MIHSMNTFSPIEPLLIEYPDAAAIRDAYRELPQRGHLHASVKLPDISATLLAFEAAGFYGMCVEREDIDLIDAEISAFKGKQGQCYETGRTARYVGAGLAALDDDNHLIVGEMRVCEKTGSIYAQAPYENLVEVTEADPQLLDSLLEKPVPFDCDTLERDARRLSGMVETGGPETPRTALFYGGPFRALVLGDGTILRRGETTTVPERTVEALLGQGGALAAETSQAKPPIFFQDLYEEKGASALLGELPLEVGVYQAPTLNLDALADIHCELRERLKQVIEKGEKQFLVTGSDPRSPFGCCPDAKVGDANALVEAGVLSSLRVPAPPDSCPTTIYAFRGELRDDASGQPVSTIIPEIRTQVMERLGK